MVVKIGGVGGFSCHPAEIQMNSNHHNDNGIEEWCTFGLVFFCSVSIWLSSHKHSGLETFPFR
jgi:hypothetical protein